MANGILKEDGTGVIEQEGDTDIILMEVQAPTAVFYGPLGGPMEGPI